jgi:FADH2 O2-dependent halogenase
MRRLDVDVAVIGAGFAGTLLATILHRQGRRVVLLEKGRHPRFALGESSTPLANALLMEIAGEHDLPWLAPLAKWGPWKRAYPPLNVGLKRGFTFVHHPAGEELLVTASPENEVADTHWVRADFDHFLVERAREMGVPYLDNLGDVRAERGPPWQITARDVEVRAAFAVDAAGAAGVLTPSSAAGMLTDSWCVYSHLVDVGLWGDISAGTPRHPYPCDAAALHHVLDDGWVYVLRFDDGLVSAGVLYDGTKRRPHPSLSPEQEWKAMLSRHPLIARHFLGAMAVRPWARTGRLQRRAPRLAGDDWALLPSAAYTLDALFSTGNAHSLWNIKRLVRLLPRWADGRCEYEDTLNREIDFIDTLVHGSYRAFGSPRLLWAWTMYYFAGAIAAEERRKKGLATSSEEFLSSHIPAFRAAVMRSHAVLCAGVEDEAAFEGRVREDIAPWNTTGLCDPAKGGMHPY